MAVNEKTGDIVQVTEGGYTGMLNVARKSMKLYFMRNEKTDTIPTTPGDTARRRVQRPVQIIEVDLEKLFADSKAGTLKNAISLSTNMRHYTKRIRCRWRYGIGWR